MRIETGDSFAALSCRYFGEDRVEQDAGSCVNADGTLFARGQETFFELEESLAGDPRQERDQGVRFRLCVTDENDQERWTNMLYCEGGEEIHIVLKGNSKTGYTIARSN